ncbi:hypothetical protein G7Y89_g10952 [Cudoniella acicularis]|uniref:Uncharacterized protein n=1 Tax=Cudoniella acicularis TaxID=354080 RepID=A0A8H4RE38_9HELO|nr:hypothetical protein G7Y89_g10952 [Cudoniella acicularis]
MRFLENCKSFLLYLGALLDSAPLLQDFDHQRLLHTTNDIQNGGHAPKFRAPNGPDSDGSFICEYPTLKDWTDLIRSRRARTKREGDGDGDGDGEGEGEGDLKGSVHKEEERAQGERVYGRRMDGDYAPCTLHKELDEETGGGEGMFAAGEDPAGDYEAGHQGGEYHVVATADGFRGVTDGGASHADADFHPN